MDFEELKLFVQIADVGSLSKAASVYGGLQSVLSRRISRLERSWGERLFHRTGRGVALTKFGESILPSVRALVLHGEQLSGEIRGRANVPTGEVRFGILASLVHPVVSTVFRQAKVQFPQIQLRLYEGSSAQLKEWVDTGRIDVAVVIQQERNDAIHGSLLGKIVLHLAGPIGDPLTQAPTVDFNRLDKLPLALPGLPSAIRPMIDQAARRRRITISVVMETDSLYAQKEIAAYGGIHTIIGSHSVRHAMREGDLQASKIINPVMERALSLVTTTQRPPTRASKAIARLVTAAMDAAPVA